MLFDPAAFRELLPEGVRVYASGANRVAEIAGFARLGIPIGVAVNHLSESAIAALAELQAPVMIDSGAFSEVVMTSEGPHVVRAIPDEEWRRRLSIYRRLASVLGDKALLVAPDQVGSQNETLRRLERYRSELVALAGTGARLLLPLQVGTLSHADFYKAACHTAGIPLTPAMPMRKAVTTATALVEFVREFKPKHIHLLGIGIDSRHGRKLVQVVRHFCPHTFISMDSNRLRAVVGMQRPLTIREAEFRSGPVDDVFGTVTNAALAATGDGLDYTDLIASPSLWIDGNELLLIAEATELTHDEASAFRRDPDTFLQSNCSRLGDLLWIEHPLMALELDRAWGRYVESRVRNAVRSAAIVTVFAGSRITGQAA